MGFVAVRAGLLGQDCRLLQKIFHLLGFLAVVLFLAFPADAEHAFGEAQHVFLLEVGVVLND